MEPPAKRARLGRAPRSMLPLDDDGGDEDEIAMDPEEFAMKQDPQYRLEVSRAVADNKLKSAFERLFEKYGKDFGDTSDEINFYTDEIEVDNGHIASLPLAGKQLSVDAEDGEEDGEEDEDEDEARILRGTNGAGKPLGSQALVRRQRPSYRSVQRNDVVVSNSSRLSSLLSPRFGLGHSLSFGTGACGGLFGRPPDPRGAFMAPGLTDGPVDPAWEVPELPSVSYSSPLGRLPGSSLILRNHGNNHFLPSRTVPRKLPFAASAGRAETVRSDGDDDDDDDLAIRPFEATAKVGGSEDKPSQTGPVDTRALLSLSTQEHTTNAMSKTSEAESPPIVVHGAGQRDEPTSSFSDAKKERPRKKRIKKVALQNKSTFVQSMSSHQKPHTVLVVEIVECRRLAEEVTNLESGLSADVGESLPTPPGDDDAPSRKDDGGAKADAEDARPEQPFEKNLASDSVKAKVTEIFSKNALDPSYAFSDEEDYGLRKRNRPRKAADAVAKAVAALEASNKPSASTSPFDGIGIIPKTAATTTATITAKAIAGESAITAAEEATTTITEGLSSPRQKERTEDVARFPGEEHGISSSPIEANEAEAKTASLKALPSNAKSAAPSTPRTKSQADQGTALSSIKRRDLDSHGRSSIISLVSDASDDEDELSLGPDDFTPSGAYRAWNEQQHLAGRNSMFGSSPLTDTKPRAVVKRTTANRKPRRSTGGTESSAGRHDGSTLISAGPSHRHYRARTVMPSSYSSPLKSQTGLLTARDAPSPNGSPVRTPGGSMRRCGQDGFKCDRDFCFKCL
ncbi:Centromere protein Scm3 [Niveomyces insectorum RCEF 264]|uniref:Centromere protein Scm3 n=1 Tax=Niveomyces insectorum RCEF 264 TaxID=1081102 RepID=A0A168A2X9_9HYPO|nr:Centromere protein Scm3 [Niveomyces insectorum RCEF 264]